MLRPMRETARVQVRGVAMLLAVAVLIPSAAFAQPDKISLSTCEDMGRNQACPIVDSGQPASGHAALPSVRPAEGEPPPAWPLGKWETARTVCRLVASASTAPNSLRWFSQHVLGGRLKFLTSAGLGNALRTIGCIGGAGLMVTGAQSLHQAQTLETRLEAGNEILTGARGVAERVAPALGALGPWAQGFGIAAGACQIAAGCKRILEGRETNDQALITLGASGVCTGAVQIAVEVAAIYNPVCLGALTAVTAAKVAYDNRELIKKCLARGRDQLAEFWSRHCHRGAGPRAGEAPLATATSEKLVHAPLLHDPARDAREWVGLPGPMAPR